MPTDRAKAEQALSARLRALLAPEVVDRFVGGSHTRRFADNLLPTFPAWQVAELYEQLKAGGGSELTPRKGGEKRTGHAPYSSAALAFNAFGRWLGSEPHLSLAGQTAFSSRLRVEGKKKIRHGGGFANLDVLLADEHRVVGVESKLVEHSELHAAKWKPPYTDPQMNKLLDPVWQQVMRDSLDESWKPVRLGIEQLIKHVLGLRSQHHDKELHLVYVFWEPSNAHDVTWVTEHRAEVDQLVQRTAGAEVSLHALTYWELLDEWKQITDGPAWLDEHIAALRQRYLVSV